MAEYWKSQPKKFCDFCKCWIADNKASIDFHEKGKKHQENVKLRIDEVKKKGTERRQQQDQLHEDLAAIEAAALKAYKKDLGLSDCATKEERKAKTSLSDESSVISPNINNWTAHQTPEGYWYYYNSKTGESRWDLPSGCQSQNDIRQIEQANTEVKNDGGSIEVTKSKENTENAISPFGRWETVAVYHGNDSAETIPVDTNQEKEENEVPAVKFKEKQLPTSKTTDMSENVSFKKRKSCQEKKRSIRQRTNDS